MRHRWCTYSVVVFVFLNLWRAAFTQEPLSQLTPCARRVTAPYADDDDYLQCEFNRISQKIVRNESYCRFILRKKGCAFAASWNGFQRLCCTTYANVCGGSVEYEHSDEEDVDAADSGGAKEESPQRRALAEQPAPQQTSQFEAQLLEPKTRSIFCREMRKLLQLFNIRFPQPVLYRLLTGSASDSAPPNQRARRRALLSLPPITPHQFLESGLKDTMQKATANAGIHDFSSLLLSFAYVLERVGERLLKCNGCVDGVVGQIFREVLPGLWSSSGSPMTTREFTSNFLKFISQWGRVLSTHVNKVPPAADLDFERFWDEYFYASFSLVFDSDALGGIVTYANLQTIQDLPSKNYVRRALSEAYPKIVWLDLKCAKLPKKRARRSKRELPVLPAGLGTTPELAPSTTTAGPQQPGCGVEMLGTLRPEKGSQIWSSASTHSGDDAHYCDALDRTIGALAASNEEQNLLKTAAADAFPSFLLRIARLPASMDDLRQTVRSAQVKSYKQLALDLVVALKGLRSRLGNCDNCLNTFIARLAEDDRPDAKDEGKQVAAEMEAVSGDEHAPPPTQLAAWLLGFMGRLETAIQHRVQALQENDYERFEEFWADITSAVDQLSKDDRPDSSPRDAETLKAADATMKAFWKRRTEIQPTARLEATNIYKDVLACTQQKSTTNRSAPPKEPATEELPAATEASPAAMESAAAATAESPAATATESSATTQEPPAATAAATAAATSETTTDPVAETKSYCALLKKIFFLYRQGGSNLQKKRKRRSAAVSDVTYMTHLRATMKDWLFQDVQDYKELALILPSLTKKTQAYFEKCPKCAHAFVENVFADAFKGADNHEPLLAMTSEQFATRLTAFLAKFAEKLQKYLDKNDPRRRTFLLYEGFYNTYFLPALKESWSGEDDLGGLFAPKTLPHMSFNNVAIAARAGEETMKLYENLHCPRYSGYLAPHIHAGLSEPPVVISGSGKRLTVTKSPFVCIRDNDIALFHYLYNSGRIGQESTLCSAFTGVCYTDADTVALLQEACPESYSNSMMTTGPDECSKYHLGPPLALVMGGGAASPPTAAHIGAVATLVSVAAATCC